MELIKLFSAFGLGAIAVKLIDIFYLQPQIEKKELNSWLRDKKLVAYTNLTSNILSMGFQTDKDSLFDHLSVAAEATLLIDDEELCQKIEDLLTSRDQLMEIQDQEAEEKLFKKVRADGKLIVKALKNNLRGKNA